MHVGIIVAMAEEGAHLRPALFGAGGPRPGSLLRSTVRPGVSYMECGVGKVNAARGATLMARVARADLIVNFGLVGAIAPALSPGDALLPTWAVHHDVDLTGFGLPERTMLGEPERFEVGGPPGDALQRALEAHGLRVHVGGMASGDRFVAEKAAARALFADTNALAVDMELAAIAQVCRHEERPAVALKIVSDSADEGAKEDFGRAVSALTRQASEVLLGWIGGLT